MLPRIVGNKLQTETRLVRVLVPSGRGRDLGNRPSVCRIWSGSCSTGLISLIDTILDIGIVPLWGVDHRRLHNTESDPIIRSLKKRVSSDHQSIPRCDGLSHGWRHHIDIVILETTRRVAHRVVTAVVNSSVVKCMWSKQFLKGVDLQIAIFRRRDGNVGILFGFSNGMDGGKITRF